VGFFIAPYFAIRIWKKDTHLQNTFYAEWLGGISKSSLEVNDNIKIFLQ
jgi:hypothetical protein